MSIWNRITETRAAAAVADWISGGALSDARQGRQANWDQAQENWRLAEQRMSHIQRLDAQLREAEAEARALAKLRREQMGQISAELSALIEEKPASAMASKLRAVRALTKG